jgi:hypothetical protein
VIPAVLAPGGLESLEVTIHPQAPLLVNDPGYVRLKKNQEDNFPDLQYSRTADGKALIPGRSLKGLLRARARRILATLLIPPTGDCTEAAGTTAED